MKKLAVIRSPETRDCPYGLSISTSCNHAGDAVERMQLLEDVEKDQRERFRAANRKIYRHYQGGTRCIYADKILQNVSAVECDFNENGAGQREPNIRPSGSQGLLSGISENSLYAYPANYSYTGNGDYNTVFPGLFSFNSLDESGEVGEDFEAHLIKTDTDLDD